MSSIRNTTGRDEQAALLADAMFLGPDAAIELQEERGRQELAASEMLPVDMGGEERKAQFEELGFVFGDTDPNDRLFRQARLPEGWTKVYEDGEPCVLDELGRKRVSIFYKAAFYDRRANMTLIGLHFYLYTCRFHRRDVVTDEQWATPAAITASARECVTELDERLERYRRVAEERPDGGYGERIPELEAERAWYVALEQRFAPETAAAADTPNPGLS